METKMIRAAIAAICVAAASASHAETHALQPYAYVESFGHNAVDTGYYAKKDTKFIADFEFVSTADGVIFGAYHDSNINVNGLYRNSAGNITWTINGPWWWSTWSPGNKTVPAEANCRITVIAAEGFKPGVHASVAQNTLTLDDLLESQ